MNKFLIGKTLIDSSRGIGKLVVDFDVWMGDAGPCVTLYTSDGDHLEWDHYAGTRPGASGGGAWVDEDDNEYEEIE